VAKKILGYVYLIWKCAFCGTENPGPIKSCTSCGAPQPADVQFEKVDQEKFEFIKDEALIRMAKTGPDKHCPYCGTRNLATDNLCKKCGSDISIDAEVRTSGEKIEDRDKTPVNPTTQPKQLSKGCLILLILAFLIACVVGGIFIFQMLSTETTNATVEAVGWERTVLVEGYTTVRGRTWYDELPAGATLVSCSTEYRYTSDQPQANATEVCGEPYTVDTGTGIGEVRQDCEYRVYDDYCEYEGMAWTVIDTLTLSGYDLQPRWPNTTLSSTERYGQQTETYTIVFNADGKQLTYNTNSLDLFSQAAVGSEWELEVNQLGAITSVQPSR